MLGANLEIKFLFLLAISCISSKDSLSKLGLKALMIETGPKVNSWIILPFFNEIGLKPLLSRNLANGVVCLKSVLIISKISGETILFSGQN